MDGNRIDLDSFQYKFQSYVINSIAVDLYWLALKIDHKLLSTVINKTKQNNNYNNNQLEFLLIVNFDAKLNEIKV
ncbi:hypothetical protein DERP_009927 [Dermatophagoides pteronyssinus]|uniref:Uncharacterized protein n=1 Tax=Dermatophagoides pteronyssinus TaxID=6956 RepID=A0ABQ8J1Y3_DERPT|nr:hypothetical protein DERP_009927 [Dermatophagoides pteronyssinus]